MSNNNRFIWDKGTTTNSYKLLAVRRCGAGSYLDRDGPRGGISGEVRGSLEKRE
jgi:hypothetical protein